MKIEIAIDNYDDLFSDFDARNYDERYFSSDFLDELRVRTHRHRNVDSLEIAFRIPGSERSPEQEALIVRRFSVFVAARLKRNRKKRKEILLKSFLYESLGILFLIIANIISGQVPEIFKDFLLIPSWFFVWNGLERYIQSRQELGAKIRYYSILEKSRYVFAEL